MSLVRRVLTGFYSDSPTEPAMFQKADGTFWIRANDGSEAQVGSGGGSLPAQWAVNADGDLAILDTGDPEGGQSILSLGTDGGLDTAHKFDNFGTWYGSAMELQAQSGDFEVPNMIQVSNGALGTPAIFYVNDDGTILMPNLPTSDPHVIGSLWNDAGTLKISAGP
jgi:hypothetical protein